MFDAGSGKFSLFSEDRNLLGCTTVHSLPCVGSEMDFCGMLVTINDELYENSSNDPAPTLTQMTPQPLPLPCSQAISAPTARPLAFESTFVKENAPSGAPVYRTDDEVLRLLMPRSMRLAQTSVSDSGCLEGSSNSGKGVGENIRAAYCASRHYTPAASTQPPAPFAPPQVNASFATSFRQLPGLKASHPVPSYQAPATANTPKPTAFGYASIFVDFY